MYLYISFKQTLPDLASNIKRVQVKQSTSAHRLKIIGFLIILACTEVK